MALRPLPLLLPVCLAAALGCGGEPADRLGGLAARLETATPTPAPTPPPTPTPPPPSANRLVVAGDVNFEDFDPEVVVLESAGRLRLELRHRVPGSSSADSTLVLLQVPPKAGTYRLVSPRSGGRGGPVQALFTTRSERVGSMKDFHHAVTGTLTLREESPGVLAAAFTADLQEPPPPPPPPPKPGEPLPSMLGKVPPAPPARVQVSGALVAVLSTARPAPTPPPGAAVAAPAPSPPRDAA